MLETLPRLDSERRIRRDEASRCGDPLRAKAHPAPCAHSQPAEGFAAHQERCSVP